MNTKYLEIWLKNGSKIFETGLQRISSYKLVRNSLFFVFFVCKWLEVDLQKVDRKITPWTVVLIHAPWHNSNTAHQGERIGWHEEIHGSVNFSSWRRYCFCWTCTCLWALCKSYFTLLHCHLLNLVLFAWLTMLYVQLRKIIGYS